MNERIKELRKTLGLTLEKFGERLGIKKNTVSQIENGINSITDQMFLAICREYNVNPDWLRTGEGEMFPESEVIIMSEDAQKTLNRYRELYNEFQERIKEDLGKEPVELSDNCLLIIALEEAITYMKLTLQER